MVEIQLIRLLISRPRDIKEELDSIKIIVEEINKTSGRQNLYSIECLNWTIDTFTDIGEDVQDVINSQLDSKYDILVGLMWQRLGTPTKRDQSGTVEEINRAINNAKQYLIYFKTAPPESLNDIDLEQLAKVKLFKEQLTKKGVLYKEYNSIENFESLFRINITNLISEKIIIKQNANAANLKSEEDKYASITKLIDEVEQKDDNSIEIDIFELSESMLSSLAIITASLNLMTNSVNDLTAKMNNRTKELQAFIPIKDNKLRLAKSQIIMNLLADELNEFNSRISLELPVFSENFIQIGPLYSKILQYGLQYEIAETSNLKTSLLDYRDSIEYAMRQSALLLTILSKWPPGTSKLNKSRRETELVVKNITKELLEGLKLLDEAVQR